MWEGHGPLSFVASIDCAGLPTAAVDIDLPKAGTLLFFYFDSQLDDGEAPVLAEDRESWPGARVLYVAAGEEAVERGTPAGVDSYPVAPLTARLEMTAAEPWHPRIRDAFAAGAPLGNRYDHPVCSQEFLEALWEFDDEVGHQIGGHAHSVQNPVEIEVAEARPPRWATSQRPRLVWEWRMWPRRSGAAAIPSARQWPQLSRTVRPATVHDVDSGADASLILSQGVTAARTGPLCLLM